MSLTANEVFAYDLPRDRIAQRPVYPYDAAKLLCLNRENGRISETIFSDFVDLLRPTDILVFNDSRVMPARLFGKLDGSEKEIELLLLKPFAGESVWRAMGRPLKKLTPGTQVHFPNGLVAEITERVSAQEIEIKFSAANETPLCNLIREVGCMPIPPYIRDGHGDEQDLIDYQPFSAKKSGSVAAPTASLHFTPQLIERIKKKGCSLEFVTLHVGTASFLQLWDDLNIEAPPNPPGVEEFECDPNLITRLSEARKAGHRVIAVGTTVVRALESAVAHEKQHKTGTELFITPGFTFKIVDALVTNFHQPRTTHLLLVEALMGKELLRRSYEYALEHEFRFLSYGDGMFVE